MFYAVDDDCDFEDIQNQFCGYENAGTNPWRREFTTDVRLGARGKTF